jgi:hypothetical protein
VKISINILLINEDREVKSGHTASRFQEVGIEEYGIFLLRKHAGSG